MSRENGKIAGIVAEYNPFHAGHAWMVEQLRRQGCAAVVCVMSGPFVQRGAGALLPTAARARAAVAGGVDLVFRLPVGWATASAEAFGAGGVGLLVALGCVDALAFGAETPDAHRLLAVADVLRDERLAPLIKERLKGGVSFAAARAAAAEALLPGAGELLASPNNILAVEYCKALRALQTAGKVEKGSAVAQRLLPLPRAGAAHDGPPVDGFASAGHLRRLYAGGGMEALAPFVPQVCLPLYKQAEADGLVLDEGRFELALLSRLRGFTEEDFAPYPAAGEGLGTRLTAAAKRAVSLEELYALAKTKRFAHARVRRLALVAALGLAPRPAATPPFLHLLAASPRGLGVLRRAKKTASLPLSASLAKLAGTSASAADVAAEEGRAEDFYALCLRKPQPGGQAFTQKVQVAAVDRAEN